MTDSKLACLVLAAGKGTRLKSETPKVLHAVAGQPMILHVADVVNALSPQRTIIVVGPEMDSVAAAVESWEVAIQQQQRGTADAVRAATGHLSGFLGDVLVVFGDTPLLPLDPHLPGFDRRGHGLHLRTHDNDRALRRQRVHDIRDVPDHRLAGHRMQHFRRL